MLWKKKRLCIELVLHLLFWAGVFYVLTSLNARNIHVMGRGSGKGPGVFAEPVKEKTVSLYVYIILIFLAALFYSNIFWVFPKVMRFKPGIVRLALCTGWFAMVIGANYFTVGPLFNQANPVPLAIHGPVNQIPPNQARVTSLDKPRRPVDEGIHVNSITFLISDWWHFQTVIGFAFLVIQGLSLAYYFLKAWAKSELIQSRLQANQLSTEIKFLKSQINPHFLFNTLNNLFSMAQAKGNDELADGISKLSGMMRYMLYDSNEEGVALSKEITYLEECIMLNKLRYADEEVKVAFDRTGPIDDTRVAPMLFIPFVENAFKYGVAIGQRATIQIAIVVTGEKLIFTCVNADYSAIKKMEISGIGLENVKRRLELVYPRKHQLIIKKEDGKFMVNLEIDRS
jgi:two-component system, LytTR family, sensor kinase